MAHLPRRAKSANDWTETDLEAYNIHLRAEDAATFFGTTELPQSPIGQEVLDVEDAHDIKNDDSANLVKYIGGAMRGEEPAVLPFVPTLLTDTGYPKDGQLVAQRNDFPFFVCGEWRHARTGATLFDPGETTTLLVVQNDHRFGAHDGEDDFDDSDSEDSDSGYLNDRDPNPQLVAAVIAAFHCRNLSRELSGRRAVEPKVMPGLVMAGTLPTFFKIPITAPLLDAVHEGTYPAEPTIVSMHIPDLPNPDRWREGMKPLENRRHILRCLEAFRGFVQDYTD
ncbi:hypothetical protein EVG20_g5438 [Dentipellis fragilis]|uniref:Uncharacterized protein n=1 Tax=Dentipellis fragilis TaxID=205917 RepID=A0A4Y9YV93_9AGAM|nr:hypothetical protein EVG20_g5438 [Dentipellis fragilis]